jgi:putative exporter of polyketide antibiotics
MKHKPGPTVRNAALAAIAGVSAWLHVKRDLLLLQSPGFIDRMISSTTPDVLEVSWFSPDGWSAPYRPRLHTFRP